MATFELKKTYNFNMKNELVPILGDKFKLMKVKGLLTADQAVKYTDIATMHQQLKPLLTSLPTNTSDMSYVLFETHNSDQVVYALEYIDLTSITEVDGINIRINIANCSTQDLATLKTAILELGYSNVEVTTYE